MYCHVAYRLASMATFCTTWKQQQLDTLRGNSSATLLSYISCVILYTSIMSPRNRLYFKVCTFNCNKRSLHGNFLSDITNFVALFWTFSIASISPFWKQNVIVDLASHWPSVTENSGLSTYRLNGLWKGDEHPAYTPGLCPSFTFTAQTEIDGETDGRV